MGERKGEGEKKRHGENAKRCEGEKEQQIHFICRLSMLNDQTKSFDVECVFFLS